jgi:hypothetical protein
MYLVATILVPTYRDQKRLNPTVSGSPGLPQEHIRINALGRYLPGYMYKIVREGSRMIMAGTGGQGRRGKFSKTKGKKGGLPKFNTAPQISIKATSLVIMPFGATSLVLTSKTALKHQLQGVPGGACCFQLLGT